MKKLSKDEMKKVMGGVQDIIICGYWPSRDYPMELGTCEGDVAGCTAACNAWCAGEPGCVNGTCTCM